MALTYFCFNCGGKNIYQFTKPKFCCNCAAPIGAATFAAPTIANPSTAVVAAAQPVPPAPRFQATVHTTPKATIRKDPPNRFMPDVEEEEEIQVDFGSMRGLQVEIDRGGRDRGISLSDLASQEPEPSAKRGRGRPPKEVEPARRGKKKVMKELPASFKAEAGFSGRGNNNDTPDFGGLED